MTPNNHQPTVGAGALRDAMAARLYIVRGHFSTYTKAAPLFGRIVGRFWIPAHARGLADEGIITTDYRVASQAA